MNNLNAKQITNILYNQMTEDDRNTMFDTFAFNTVVVLVGSKEHRDEAIKTYLNLIQLLTRVDDLHKQNICEQDVITH